MTVTNSGNIAGDEVVQVYVNDLVSSVTQPLKRLVGFKRITLGPGESKKLFIDIPLENLKLVNRSMEWVLEPGMFSLMAGSSSKDIRMEGVFEVTGN